MKRIALFFFGLSYLKKYNHRDTGETDINYVHSLENYKKYIFDYFNSYEIDVYYTTNVVDKEIQQKLEDDYKPKKCTYMDIEDSNKICRNTRLIQCLQLCKDEYDYCFITRFDLLFQEKFQFNYDKLNMVSILEKQDLICDNFYFMPYSMFEEFKKVCIKNTSTNFHYIKSDLETISIIHYLKNENKRVQDLSFYKIEHFIREQTATQSTLKTYAPPIKKNRKLFSLKFN
jgi:hypothetical protein